VRPLGDLSVVFQATIVRSLRLLAAPPPARAEPINHAVPSHLRRAPGGPGGSQPPPRRPCLLHTAVWKPPCRRTATTLQPNAAPEAKAPAKPAAAAPPAKAAPARSRSSAAAADLRRWRPSSIKAIGVMTKLSIKNQVDDLLSQFRAFYQGKLKTTLAELRRPFDLLVLKLLSLLQDSDPTLAAAIVASREAIWGILSDRTKFASLDGG
jgi:hypothetical protein